jgi:hypothetical protein
MKMARVKYDAQVWGLPAEARATADQVRDLVRRKFPSPPLDAHPSGLAEAGLEDRRGGVDGRHNRPETCA